MQALAAKSSLPRWPLRFGHDARTTHCVCQGATKILAVRRTTDQRRSYRQMPAEVPYTAGGEQLHKILQKGAPAAGQFCAEAAEDRPRMRRRRRAEMRARVTPGYSEGSGPDPLEYLGMTSSTAELQAASAQPSPPSSTSVDSCSSSTSCSLCRSIAAISERRSSQTSSKRGSSHSLMSFNWGIRFRRRSRKRT